MHYAMPLYLLNPAVDLTLELYVSPEAEKAMCIQWERITDRNVRDTYVRKLETAFERVLAETMDWDIKPPTSAQLRYAELVAKQLSIALPSEARTFRYHTAMFLETYVPRAKALGTATESGMESGAMPKAESDDDR